MTVQETIQNRDEVHGDYTTQAKIADEMMQACMRGPKGLFLSPEMRQSLVMICIKVARIVSGDPTCSDHWHDIAGYATLVEQRLVKQDEQL